MPLQFLPVALSLSDPKTQAKANSLAAAAEKLLCRLKGSCAPKFAAAVASVGFAGYRRGTSSAWNYYSNEGIHLTQDLSKWYNAQAWYFGSGYWEKLRQAGLDNCCLKQKWPPTEAFPLTGKPSIATKLVNLPNGKQVEVDPERFDPTSFQQEVDDYFRKQGGIAPNTGITTTQQNTPLQTPLIAGNALPLGLLAWLFFKS